MYMTQAPTLGATMTPANWMTQGPAIVTRLYRDYLLRDPGPTELSTWVSAVAATPDPEAAMFEAILKSSERAQLVQGGRAPFIPPGTPQPKATTNGTGIEPVWLLAGAAALLLLSGRR